MKKDDLKAVIGLAIATVLVLALMGIAKLALVDRSAREKREISKTAHSEGFVTEEQIERLEELRIEAGDH